jgi:hypothetical protein
VGIVQRPEFWGALGFAGHCRLYRSVFGHNDLEIVTDRSRNETQTAFPASK